MLFIKHHICFFRLGHAVFTFVKPSSHGGYYLMQGDGVAVPLYPLGHSQLKMWKTEPSKLVNSSKGSQGALRAPCIKIIWRNKMSLNVNKKTHLVSPRPAFYITGDHVFNNRQYPPTWIYFWLIIALKFN